MLNAVSLLAFFGVGLMYWLQYCSCFKFVKSRSLYIHLPWMEVRCFTAIKTWTSLRAMGSEDLFTVANEQSRPLVVKTQYCPFLGVGLRSSESFVAWAQQCFFGKEGFVPGGGCVSRRVPRRGAAAASSRRVGTKRDFIIAGLVHGETTPTPTGSLPFPPGEAACSWLCLLWHKI